MSPSRQPFGLRPVLPDPSANPSSPEDRISQEASELEKRLSMLSVCSHHSSAASTFSYGTSLGGDDRCISSSSSETSRSDSSAGSRLTIWAEQVRNLTPVEPPSLSLLQGAAGSKSAACSVSTSTDERLYGAVMGGLRPPSKPPHLRGLHEAGRQNSTDSGIATGSHSSYSGSFSSYTDGIDVVHGETEDFGSSVSLPPNFHHHMSAQTIPLRSGHKSCACPLREAGETQTSAHLQYYDVPRQVLLHPQVSTFSPQQRLECVDGVTVDNTPQKTAARSFNWCVQGVMPPEGATLPPQQRPTICPDCGGVKMEKSKCDTRSRSEQPKALHRKCDLQGNYEQMAFTADASRWLAFRAGESATTGNMQTCPVENPADPANYVNIPISPTSKRQLHYMELDLQERPESSHTVRAVCSSTKYAYIDITATETAQRVGAKHAQGREERLQELQKRRGTLASTHSSYEEF